MRRITKNGKSPAVFLDRDGVLIPDVEFVIRRDQVKLYPGVSEALAGLRAAGYTIVVVSNQPVVARGLAPEAVVDDIHAHLQDLLRTTGTAQVDRFYYCPHHPEAELPEYRVDCSCRKPYSGMLLQAAQDLDLDLEASFMVGDRVSDVIAGQRVGCTTMQVETGMHTAPPIISAGMDESVRPDYTCAGLPEAVEIILGLGR